MIRRLTFRAKIFACFGVLMALALSLAVWAMRSVSEFGRDLEQSANVTAKKIQLSGELRAGFQEMRVRAQSAQISLVMGMLESPNATTSAHSSGAPCVTCHTRDRIRTNYDKFQGVGNRLQRTCREMRSLGLEDDEAQSAAAIEAGVSEWMRVYEDYLRMAAGKEFGKAHQLITDRVLPQLAHMEKVALGLEQHQSKLLQSAARDAQDRVVQSRRVAVVILGISIVCGLVVAVIVYRSSEFLRRIAAELSEQAQSLVSAANEIASGSQSLASGASQQVAALQEALATSQEVREDARRNAAHSLSASSRVQGSEQQSANAGEALQEMVSAMAEIGESSNKISRIMKTIDEIAFQTNILALNAAVEAARAGQAGAGFAVVADEVRNLAQRCASAANDTSALIEESIDRSRLGKAKLDRVSDAIEGIINTVREIGALMNKVSESSRRQADNTDQIGSAINQIEQVTNRTERAADESAAAADQLNGNSRELQEVVRRLTEMVGSRSITG